MRFKKSILSRGIIFVMGILAMTIFSFTKVNATCEVKFQDEKQYLTLGGDYFKWSDSGIVGNSDCGTLTPETTTINGVEATFTINNMSAGSYTVGYNYTWNNSSTSQSGSGVIYRYLRILDSNYSTRNNYTLADFNLEGASQEVVASYSYSVNGEYYFVNFVKISILDYLYINLT